MATATIKYYGGFKYRLSEKYEAKVNINLNGDIQTPFIDLTVGGKLTIKELYAWDGASGPAKDTKTFMRGSLVHDALYQLMRHGKLEQVWRKRADKELKRICLEDGMSRFRAWYVYGAVRFGAGPAADPSAQKKEQTAP